MAGKREKDKKIDLDFEIGFYEGLLKKKPDFIQALVVLGDAYTRRGDFKKGLEIDLHLVRLRKDDPGAHYNLACSYSLLGLIDDAFRSIKKAIALGYHNFEYLCKDPDLENLKKDKRFHSLFRGLKC